jgi:hypothetical protein
MQGYLGTFDVPVSETPFAAYTPADWAMYYVGSYGQIDGEHHKLWVLDQVARILKGTPVIARQARWDNGQTEWRVSVGEPTPEYHEWVKEMRGEFDEDWEEYEYSYDEGTPP